MYEQGIDVKQKASTASTPSLHFSILLCSKELQMLPFVCFTYTLKTTRKTNMQTVQYVTYIVST